MHTPLTHEQLEFMTEQTRRAVRKASRRALVGYLLLFVGVILMYENGQSVSGNERDSIVASGRAVAVDGCNRDFRDREAVRGVLVAAENSVKRQIARKIISDEQATDALRFYASQLNRLKLPDCREADDLLTSSPDKKLPHIAPLHP